MRYSDIVDYDKLDSFKEESMRRLRDSLANISSKWGIFVVEETVGETAVAVDMGRLGEHYMAFNVEGLGTKNMIAEAMAEKREMARAAGLDVRKLFSGIGRDVMAMSLNDLTAIGATPIVYEPIVATGNDDYLTDQQKSSGIIDGFEEGARMAGVAIPGGETPTLKGLVYPTTVDFAGGSMGVISPKSRLLTGRRLEAGLAIFGISSSGIHSNGVSLARKIAEKLPEGYFTQLPNGLTLGQRLLTPTVLYPSFVEEMFEGRTDVRYMQPITGHGFAKIMRSKKPLKYVIDNLPEPYAEFKLLQKIGEVSDEEAHKTWNMNVGLVVFAPESEESNISRAAGKYGLNSWKLGGIEKGERSVVIAHKDITYRPK